MSAINNNNNNKVANRLNRLTGQLNSSSKCADGVALFPQQTAGDFRLGAQTLQKEREQASFKVRELTHVLDGGKKITELKEKVMIQIERDPILNQDVADVPPVEHRAVIFRQLKRMLEYKEQDDVVTWDYRHRAMGLISPSYEVRYGIHNILFKQAILQNGTPEQIKQYVDDVENLRITGCFAMTELGHGSYIQGFETTAVYDSQKDEFVIHTPTDTATKWWIGGAAHTCYVCVCYARLLINGKDYGVQNFIVPLRRREDFSLYPGVTVGDCGSKMGRLGIDNGWIQFNHVRIPRTSMLMRYSKVSREGVFTQPPMAQMSYGALLSGRVAIISNSALTAEKAVTIATRYAIVRRQFPAGKPVAVSGPTPTTSLSTEQPILDYATHVTRLMPILAECYAVHFTAQALEGEMSEAQKQIQQGNVGVLKDLHGLSSGLKAFTTWFTHNAIDVCRQCCGGHGYSAYAGFSEMFNDFAIMCTWEGDNTVMAQQTSRYLTSSLQSVMKGKKAAGSTAYLQNYQQTLAAKFDAAGKPVEQALRDPAVQLSAHEYVATKILVDASLKLKKLGSSGVSATEAWNQSNDQLVEASRAHSYAYMVREFNRKVEQQTDASLRSVLRTVADLFALYHLKSRASTLLEDGYMTGAQVKALNKLVLDLCYQVRAQAIPLVDAFNLNDVLLRSPLGRYDGNIYEHYFARVKSYPNCQNRPFYWEEIRPVLNRPFSGPGPTPPPAANNETPAESI